MMITELVKELTKDFYPKSVLGLVPIEVTLFVEDVITPDFLVHLICKELDCDMKTAEYKLKQPQPPKIGYPDYAWTVSLMAKRDIAIGNRLEKERAKKKEIREEQESEKKQKEEEVHETE